MKVEVAILGSPSFIVHTVSGRKATFEDARGLRESRGGRPGLPVPNTVIVLMVSVDVRQH